MKYQPRKVELMCAYSIKRNYHESVHITMKTVFVPTITSLVAVIFIS